jgi:A/G-specific adenine glycosylase
MQTELKKEVEARKAQIVQSIMNWGRENVRDFPWRRDRSPYKVLVAEIILRRTTAKAACRIYEDFIKRYPDIYSLSRSDVKNLEEILSAVGYHKQRAVILKEVAGYITSYYNGVIPSKRGDLLKIPHVGPYIAGAVLSLGYGIPAVMVDSNVQRIISRIFSESLPARNRFHLIMEIVEAILPQEGHQLFNLAMLDLGALICKYVRPLCRKCVLSQFCDVALSTTVDQ